MDDFQETTITIKVLSEGDISCDTLEDLERIARECSEGDYVLLSMDERPRRLTPKQMANALKRADSTPSFFMLNDDGTPDES